MCRGLLKRCSGGSAWALLPFSCCLFSFVHIEAGARQRVNGLRPSLRSSLSVLSASAVLFGLTPLFCVVGHAFSKVGVSFAVLLSRTCLPSSTFRGINRFAIYSTMCLTTNILRCSFALPKQLKRICLFGLLRSAHYTPQNRALASVGVRHFLLPLQSKRICLVLRAWSRIFA